MQGLLLKDFYIAKNNILVSITSLLVLGFGISFLMETSTLLILAPAISTTAVFISITAEAGSKWNRNVITMPVTRKQIVAEKYVIYLLLAMVGLVAALVPCFALAALRHDLTLNSVLLYSILGLETAFFAGGISLPFAYFFDAEKSQIVFMFSYVGAAGITAALTLLINLFMPVKNHMLFAFGIDLLISLVLFAGSYLMSASIYNKRDIA